jgi:rhodanese-related sulfurtransferase
MAPGALAFAWLGYAGREAIAGNDTAIRYGLMGLALLAAIAFLPRLVRGLKREVKPVWIEIGELAARLDSGAGVAVVDVRGPEEFTGSLGHIREALNLPMGELPARVHDLVPLAGRPIVLVCHTDKRSSRAAALFSRAGFGDVRVLRGCMVRWSQAGLPVDGRSSPPRA